MTIELVTIDKYYTAANLDYRGNAAIEWCPPLSKSKIAALLSSIVNYDDEERTHSVDVRMQYVHRVLRFFIPFPAQVDFAFNLWTTILQSYVGRDPQARKTQQDFNEMCESLANDSFMVTDGKSIFESPNCVLLCGTPGCGKTWVPKILLKYLSRNAVFYHLHRGGFFQKLYIWVEAPNLKSDKSMARVVYLALYEALQATGAVHPKLGPSATATELGAESAVIARRLHIGVIVVDEIQHAVRMGGMDVHSMEFLTAFINKANCPVLLIGTWKALALVRSELRLSRRSISPASALFWRLQPGEDFGNFIRALFNLQYTMNKVEATEPLIARYYHHGQGVPDVTVKLHAIVQLEAIASGEEAITIELLDQCADRHLDAINPAIRAMRDGTKEDAPTMSDAEPKDFTVYFAWLEAECRARRSERERNREATLARQAQNIAAVAGAFTSLGMASPNTAHAIAAGAIGDNPNATPVQVVASAIRRTQAHGPRPSRSVKQQAKRDVSFEQLEDEDVRKVVYFAGRRGVEPIDALRESGHLANLRELVAV